MARTKSNNPRVAQASNPPRAFKAIGKRDHAEIRLPAVRRVRPGTVALREVRMYQRSTDLLLRRAPFQRLVRNILEQLAENDLRYGIDDPTRYRMSREALACLQEAAESFLVRCAEQAHLLTAHAQRKTLFRKDILLFSRMNNIEPLVIDYFGRVRDRHFSFADPALANEAASRRIENTTKRAQRLHARLVRTNSDPSVARNVLAHLRVSRRP